MASGRCDLSMSIRSRKRGRGREEVEGDHERIISREQKKKSWAGQALRI